MHGVLYVVVYLYQSLPIHSICSVLLKMIVCEFYIVYRLLVICMYVSIGYLKFVSVWNIHIHEYSHTVCMYYSPLYVCMYYSPLYVCMYYSPLYVCIYLILQYTVCTYVLHSTVCMYSRQKSPIPKLLSPDVLNIRIDYYVYIRMYTTTANNIQYI